MITTDKKQVNMQWYIITVIGIPSLITSTVISFYTGISTLETKSPVYTRTPLISLSFLYHYLKTVRFSDTSDVSRMSNSNNKRWNDYSLRSFLIKILYNFLPHPSYIASLLFAILFWLYYQYYVSYINDEILPNVKSSISHLLHPLWVQIFPWALCFWTLAIHFLHSKHETIFNTHKNL